MRNEVAVILISIASTGIADTFTTVKTARVQPSKTYSAQTFADPVSNETLANKYYELITTAIRQARVAITPDGETEIHNLVVKAAERSRERETGDADSNARTLGSKIAKNAHFSERYGKAVVDADVVKATMKLLCPPPFYPFC